MKYSFALLFFCGLLIANFCQAQSVDKDALVGQFVYKTLLFDRPIDMNADGKSSRKFEDEADACAVDIRYEFNADGTGKCLMGMSKKKCERKQERLIKWKVRQGKGTTKMYLVISDADGFDPTPFEIVAQTETGITIRGEFNDGSDSTSEGSLELIKQKQ